MMRDNISIYDAHIHFNMSSKNPIEDLKVQIKSNNIVGFLLILNFEAEKEYFINNLQGIFNINVPFEIGVLLDFNNIDYKFLTRLDSLGISYSIKIHPRLTNIHRVEFEKIYEVLKILKYQNIIIDGFYYGSKLESHINLELLIYLAQNLPNKKFLYTHSGGHKILETLLYTRELKNIYYDLSFTQSYLKNTSINPDIINFIKFNNERILFGTDYPEFTIENSIEDFFHYLNNLNLNNEKQENLFSLNALRFFKGD